MRNRLLCLENPQGIFFAALLCFIAWLPYLICFYPGAIGYDEAWSIMQMVGSGSMPLSAGGESYTGHFAVDHKPIIHTFILGTFVHLGNFIGSQSIGLFLLIVLQSAFMAFAAAVMVSFLYRWECDSSQSTRPRHIVSLLSLAFFCLFPGIPLSLVCPSNDALFAACFVLWMVFLAEVIRTKGAYFKSRKRVIVFVFLCVGLVLFKKTGLIIVLITLLIFAFLPRLREARKPLLISGAAALLAGMFVSFVVYPLADVIPGGKQEALAPLMQLTAAYVIEHGDEVTTEEKETIDKVLEYDSLVALYQHDSHDPLKHSYRQEASLPEIIDYCGVWLSQGFKHPLTYAKAWWGVASGYVKQVTPLNYLDNRAGHNTSDMVEIVYGYNDYSQVTDVRTSINLNSPSWAMDAQEFIYACILKIGQTPLVILLCSPLYALWIPLVCFIITLIRNRPLAWVYVPVWLSIAVIFISPIISFRYAFPLACIAPLLIGIASHKTTSGKLSRRARS